MKKIIFLIIMAISLSSCTGISKENQLKEDRDQVRLTDMKNLETMINLYYQDNQKYPLHVNELKIYGNIPQDSLDFQTINECTFGYLYNSKMEGIKITGYNLSTCLESENKIEKFAKNDGGLHEKRYEIIK